MRKKDNKKNLWSHKRRRREMKNKKWGDAGYITGELHSKTQ